MSFKIVVKSEIIMTFKVEAESEYAAASLLHYELVDGKTFLNSAPSVSHIRELYGQGIEAEEYASERARLYNEDGLFLKKSSYRQVSMLSESDRKEAEEVLNTRVADLY